MARLPRLFIEGCPAIIAVQSMYELPILASVDSAMCILQHIEKASKELGLPVHAFCITSNEVILMLSPAYPKHLGKFVQQVLQQSYVLIKSNLHSESCNKLFQGNIREFSGSLWRPRFRSTAVQPGHKLLVAQWCVEHWIQMQHSSIDVLQYPFSSYAVHVGTRELPWLIHASEYWGLGNTPFERQQSYYHFGKHHINFDDLLKLKKYVFGGWLWSEPDFAEQVAHIANRRVNPLPAGRSSNG